MTEEYHGINIKEVTYWEAGESIHNLVWDGITLTEEDIQKLEDKFTTGFVLKAWYGEEEKTEADEYIEVNFPENESREE
jgi:hypothetical protein